MSDPVMQRNPSLDPVPSNSASSRSFLLFTVIALGLALAIRFFIAAPYLVDGSSMEPNFYNAHYLVVDRLSYAFGEPSRGDVIVFDLPDESDNPKKSLIKRVIGLPHETVKVNGDTVTIVNDAHPDGFELNEPYLDPANLDGRTQMQMTLGPDEFFVLGDNRHVSSDSRVWGVLPRENIVGRAILRLYPFNMIDVFPGAMRYIGE